MNRGTTRENEKEAHNKLPHSQGSIIRIRTRNFDPSFLFFIILLLRKISFGTKSYPREKKLY